MGHGIQHLCVTFVLVWLSIFCALANDDTAVVRIKCFAPSNVGHVQTWFL